MWLFAGLGNPGDEYARHRHNIGFMAVDAILHGAGSHHAWREKFGGHYCEERIDNQKISFIKPQTYMNKSGEAVIKVSKFFKINPDRIVIFYDELDLRFGQVKVKKGGGAAGHNGIKSVQTHLGTPEFWRVRIGIGHPGHKDEVTNHVLGNFAKSEETGLEIILDALAKQCPIILEDGPEAYGQAVNTRIKQKMEGA